MYFIPGGLRVARAEIGTGRIDTFCGIGPLTSRRSAACAHNVAKIIYILRIYLHPAKYYYTGAHTEN